VHLRAVRPPPGAFVEAAGAIVLGEHPERNVVETVRRQIAERVVEELSSDTVSGSMRQDVQEADLAGLR
jgi:hypothetical protein